MVTDGGVVFLATTYDNTLRAFDRADGVELWTHVLSASAHSTPMAYHDGGMDYVVVTAGGDPSEGEGRGDFVVAFRLDAASK